jgi:hypothetical protein
MRRDIGGACEEQLRVFVFLCQLRSIACVAALFLYADVIGASG